MQTVFLATNLTTALSLAPPSPTLSLLHLRHLIRNGSPPAAISACAESLTSLFGGAPTDPTTRTRAWLARLEVSLSLSLTVDALLPLFDSAVRSLPFASSLWALYASTVPSLLPTADTATWFETAIATSLLNSALPPPDYEQSGTPREVLPRAYLAFLQASYPATDVADRIERLVVGAPTLPLEFLRDVLDLDQLGQARRDKIAERVLRHRDAGAEDWIHAAKAELEKGEVQKANEVVRRAGRALSGADKAEFDAAWAKVCDGE